MTYLASICDNCSKPLSDREPAQPRKSEFEMSDEDFEILAQTCEACGGVFCSACIGDLDHNCEASL